MGKKSFSYFLKIVIEGFHTSPTLFLLEFFQSAISITQSVIGLISIKLLLRTLQQQKITDFLIIAVTISCANFLLSSVSAVIDPLISKNTERFNNKIVNAFLKKAERIHLSKFDEQDFYSKYALAFDKCCNIFHTYITCFIQILSAILNVIVTIFALSWAPSWYVVFLLVFALLQTIIGNSIKKESYAFQTKIMSKKKNLNYIYRLFYIPEFMRDIRVNNISDFIFKKKERETVHIINETYATQKLIRNKRILQLLVTLIESIFVVVYLGYQVFYGKIWIDTFAVSQTAYMQMKSSILGLLSITNSIYENELFAHNYIEFMEAEETTSSGNLSLISDQINTIEFRDVSFRYPNGKGYALKNISFNISKGEKVLITGKNGSGKTTIIKLLLRLYEPTDGSILLNGIDLKEYQLSDLRNSFSVLFQDYAIYAFSIYDNLVLSRKVNDDQIDAVVEKIGLKRLIEQLPEGIDTPISCQLENGGIELSGGEQQRLAVGRTLLKNSSFVILDEPTSNLDPVTANELVFELLKCAEISVISISHQLSYAKHFSKIIVLDSGCIAEYGTHNELRLRNGIYAQLLEKFEGNL